MHNDIEERDQIVTVTTIRIDSVLLVCTVSVLSHCPRMELRSA